MALALPAAFVDASALPAGARPRAGAARPPSKNRVGGFARPPAFRAPAHRPQRPESHQVARPAATRTASARCFVGNNPVNAVDPLGLTNGPDDGYIRVEFDLPIKPQYGPVNPCELRASTGTRTAYQDPNSAQARGQYWADNNLLSALGSGVKAGTPEGRVMAQSAADNIVLSLAEPGIGFLAQDARVALAALREGHSLARARAVVEIAQEVDLLNPCMATCNRSLNSSKDRLLDSLGPAHLNNADELAEILADLRLHDVPIDYRAGQYAYGPRVGEAGNLVIDENASISAWRHEYGHFLDDLANGRPGLRAYMENPSLRLATERRQYLREIQTARQINDEEARRQLILDYLEEKAATLSK